MRINNYPTSCSGYSKQVQANISYSPRSDYRVDNNVQFTGLSSVVFDRLSSLVYDPLRGFEEFSTEEYSKLSKFELSVLRSRFKRLINSFMGDTYKDYEIAHCCASDSLKNGLDAKYGEGKYNVVIVGRSLSSIGKMLGYKIGEKNVIQLPLSDGSRYNNASEFAKVVNSGEITYLEKYLESRGLSKESVINSDKKTVLIDYCCSGATLKGAEKLFKHIYRGSDNIVAEDPLKLVDDNNLRFCLAHSLLGSNYKEFSFVNKSRDLFHISESFRDVKRADYDTRLFWFKIMDDAMCNVTQKYNDISWGLGKKLNREC